MQNLKSFISRPSYFFVLATIWLISRSVMFIIYSPIIGGDSLDYQQYADQIAAMDFSRWDARRVPVYPLLMAVTGNDYYLIWGIQAFLGLITSFLIFQMIYRYSNSILWAYFGSLLQLLALNQMFFEPMILTENLSGFLLTLACALFYRLQLKSDEKIFHLIVGVSVSCALLTMTRPNFIYLAPLLMIFYPFIKRKNRLKIYVGILSLSLLPVIGLMYFNKINSGYFSISTNAGFGMTNHSGAFIEHVSDEFTKIRDVYLKYRELQVADRGYQALTIHRARTELRQVTGLSDAELSQQCRRLSVELFWKFPGQYSLSIAKAWVMYWTVPNYWSLEKIRSVSLINPLKILWSIQHIFFRSMNLLFVTFFFVYMTVSFRHFIRNKRFTVNEEIYCFPITVSLVVLVNSVLQAIMENAENGRYYTPTQPLVIVAFILFLVIFVRNYKKIKSNFNWLFADKFFR